MNADYFRTLVDYHYGTHKKMWDSILTLTDDQFVQETGYSIGSVRNHVVHLMDVDQRWFKRIKGEPLGDRLNYADFPTATLAYARWQQIEDDNLAFASRLDDAALERVIEYDLPHRGGIKRDAVWQIMAHVVNHGTDHRAQVLALLDSYGAPTFEQDLINHLWNG